MLDDPTQSGANVAETDPDVVIVDLQVKNMGGMAVVREIKASLEGEDCPVW